MKGTHAGEVHSKIQTSNFIVQLFDQHIKPTNHKETQIREVTLLDLVEQSLDEATVKLLELKQCKQAIFNSQLLSKSYFHSHILPF